MRSVVTIDRNTICCNTLEALIPGVVPSLVGAANGSGNWGVLGKTMQILITRNFSYLSFAGSIIGAVGTAVGSVKNSPPTEYTFAAVLCVSFLGAVVSLKYLSKRVEEYLYVIEGFKNRTAVVAPTKAEQMV